MDIIDHGQWDNPRVSGELRHYEVMTYCKGGSLDKINLKETKEGFVKLLNKLLPPLISAISMGLFIGI